jgi:hypothetical protein
MISLPNPARRLRSAAVVGLPALLLAACATTQMNADWRDPALAPAAFKAARVVVVCRAADETLRRVCEDQWAGQLAAQGLAPAPSYAIAGFPVASADTSDEMNAALRAAGVAALAAMSLAPGEVAVVSSGPQVGVGVGGSSGGRGGGFSVGGIGISFPIGGPTASQGLGASAAFVDVAGGRIVWSGKASAPPSGDLARQVVELTQVTTGAMRRAALF